jgi:hypothetical protein
VRQVNAMYRAHVDEEALGRTPPPLPPGHWEAPGYPK